MMEVGVAKFPEVPCSHQKLMNHSSSSYSSAELDCVAKEATSFPKEEIFPANCTVIVQNMALEGWVKMQKGNMLTFVPGAKN